METKEIKWRLRYKGRPFGKKYDSEAEALAAYIRMWPCMHGLTLGKVSA